MRALALLLLLTACSSESGDRAASDALDAALTSRTIDGLPAPAKRTPDRLPAIPDAYRGRWSSGGDCGATAENLLAIDRLSLTRAGLSATPSYILRAGPDEISIELALADGGRDTMTLRLAGPDRLSRRDPDGSDVDYARCPPA